MRQSLALAGALAATASAQSASSLTYWYPGPANNPSRASKYSLTATFPPVASIISSNAATTVFALGCPTSTSSPSSIFNGEYYESCTWATDSATYSIISSTRHVVHRSAEQNSYSMWWTCDYDAPATKMTCDLEVSGDVNDNTGGPISGLVWGPEPDKIGNVMAFATAEVVTQGRFGELDCEQAYNVLSKEQQATARSCNSDGTGGKGTMTFSVGSESAEATGSGAGSSSPTATQGSGSGAAATASSTAGGSVASPTVGAAGGFGVDAIRLAALVGGAAVAAW